MAFPPKSFMEARSYAKALVADFRDAGLLDDHPRGTKTVGELLRIGFPRAKQHNADRRAEQMRIAKIEVVDL